MRIHSSHTFLVLVVITALCAQQGTASPRETKRTQGGKSSGDGTNGAASTGVKSLIDGSAVKALEHLNFARGCNQFSAKMSYSRAVRYLSRTLTPVACEPGKKSGDGQQCFASKNRVKKLKKNGIPPELLFLQTGRGSQHDGDVLLASTSEDTVAAPSTCTSFLATTLASVANAIYGNHRFTAGLELPCPICGKKGESVTKMKVIAAWPRSGSGNEGAQDEAWMYSLVGVLFELNGVPILAFRGTNNWSNWATNINSLIASFQLWSADRVTKPRYAPGSVHLGFYRAYWHLCVTNGMCADLARIIPQHYSGQHLLVTGHSLGGAIAQAATADLAHMKLPIKSLKTFTYGQPRLGTYDFVQWYEQSLGKHNHVRFVAEFPCNSIFQYLVVDADTVTQVPPYPLFNHAGTKCVASCCHGFQSSAILLGMVNPQCIELGLACHMMDTSYDVQKTCKQPVTTST